MKSRKNTDKQKFIKPEKSECVFSGKKAKNRKLQLSEQWYKSLLESFGRFKKEFISHKQ